MNQKQAKRLRKASMGLATTLAEQGKDIKQDGYIAKVHDKKFQEVAEGQPLKSWQIMVRPDSLKGIYKSLKKAARAT
jgi:hypothetical protein